MRIFPSVMMAALLVLPGAAQARSKSAGKPHAEQAHAAKPVPKADTQLVYIGTFTNETGSPRSENHGQGIYAADLDLKTGTLSAPRLVAKIPSPSWMIIDQKRAILYTTNEYNGFGDDRSGSVSAFAIDKPSGALTLINTATANGAPTYIARDPSGKYIVTANYGEGSISVLKIRDDGGIGDVVDQIKTSGPRNPDTADDNPPGQFYVSSHAHPHPHMVGFDPSGRFMIANDAGLDQILVFKLDPATGKLAPNDPPAFVEKPGAAPRHYAFSPGGRAFYDVMEQDSRLAVYSFDPDKGSFALRQKLSTLPDGFAGSNLASELLITKDGNYLYVANRGHDTIVAFAVQKDGLVKKIGEVPCEAEYPRSIALDPSGRFLFSMNQRGDNVTVYAIDPRTHLPRFKQFLALGSPGSMAFVEK